MTKKSSDEPDDKALQRLRQFEEQRNLEPIEPKGKGKKNTGKKNQANKNEPGNKPDTASDK